MGWLWHVHLDGASVKGVLDWGMMVWEKMGIGLLRVSSIASVRLPKLLGRRSESLPVRQ